MSEQNDGGLAFPQPSRHEVDGWVAEYGMGGMSLRDYFAAKAMQGLIASGGTVDIHGDYLFQVRAQTCYAVADAMLAEREK